MLGEREQAVGLARKALAVVPELPAAMALLAYLEAAGLANGQEEYLRDLLKMLDTAIAKDEPAVAGGTIAPSFGRGSRTTKGPSVTSAAR